MKQKLILWLMPENKKSKISQFHTEAESTVQAIKNLENEAKEKFKVLGVSVYKKEAESDFVNNEFI
jgi:hypothetical protein